MIRSSGTNATIANVRHWISVSFIFADPNSVGYRLKHIRPGAVKDLDEIIFT
jgi:hypothetical protein